MGMRRIRMGHAGASHATDSNVMIRLEPEILHGGIAQVLLPDPPNGHRWRVEWRVIGTGQWHVVANGLAGAEQWVDDTKTPVPQHLIEWRAELDANTT